MGSAGAASLETPRASALQLRRRGRRERAEHDLGLAATSGSLDVQLLHAEQPLHRTAHRVHRLDALERQRRLAHVQEALRSLIAESTRRYSVVRHERKPDTSAKSPRATAHAPARPSSPRPPSSPRTESAIATTAGIAS